jgi:hypothetical protein
MGVGKCHPHGRQTVDVWSLGLFIPTQVTNPMIQVIHSDEEHVWFALLGSHGNAGMDAK